MKLCIPVSGPDGLSAALEADFGAARHLVIIDSETGMVQAIDREQPDQITEGVVSGIQGILCSTMHPRLLFELQQNGIEVFGCEAATAGDALDQFRAGTLEAVPQFSVPPEHAGGCCGGHGHDDDHECCGGAGHDDPDHECCGGKGHDHDEGHSCHGGGHGDDHECCGGAGHDDPDHECCGGKGHGSGGACACGS